MLTERDALGTLAETLRVERSSVGPCENDSTTGLELHDSFNGGPPDSELRSQYEARAEANGWQIALAASPDQALRATKTVAGDAILELFVETGVREARFRVSIATDEQTSDCGP